MKNLNRRLFISFIVLSLSIILSISIIFKISMKKSFNSYIEDCNSKRIEEVVNDIGYAYENGKWNKNLIANIGENAIEDGLIITITDIRNREIWSANTEHGSKCDMMMENANANMHKIDPKMKGDYMLQSFPIVVDGIKRGDIEIGHYGPFYYRDVDTRYFDTLNKSIIITIFIAIILSFVIGAIISSSINKPIFSVIDTVKLLAKGNYKERIKKKSNIIEIQEMIYSINIMAERLDSVQMLRKRLTKDISHELRTPIAIIVGQLEAIRDGIWEPSEERINGIYEEIQRISRLINSLDKLAQIEDEESILHKEKTDIKELIEGLFINFEKELLDKKIEGRLNLEECTLSVDKDKLSQGILNLISNAVRYTESGGEIEVGIIKGSKCVRIYVKDTGIGIGKEHIPFIFDRFYRTDESRARVTGGSGVGLSITKAIVEAHGGTMELISNIGEGSKFTIELPLDS